MNCKAKQTVVIFSGLPYSGKTVIIQKLLERLPGQPIYVDGLFRNMVPEKDVCLDRWLEEGPRLVDGIIENISHTDASFIYIEVGIMQMKHRKRLMDWIRKGNYHLLPILLKCDSKNSVEKRQAEREEQIKIRPENLKIAIGLEELYGPISEAFDAIMEWEGYHIINTDKPIEENIDEICGLISY